MDLHTRVTSVDELESMHVYDRADLEQHLAALAAEGDLLRSAITAAEARRDALGAGRPRSATEQIGAIMMEAQADLTAEWDACHRFGAALEEATEALAARILAEGGSLADGLQTIVAEMRDRDAGATPDAGELWWNDVIDLRQATQAGDAAPADQARIA